MASSPSAGGGGHAQRHGQGIHQDHRQAQDGADHHDDARVGCHGSGLGQDGFAGTPDQLVDVGKRCGAGNDTQNAGPAEERQGEDGRRASQEAARR